jgi:RimJ/RimL family protein N-acetyltransferase
MADAHRACPTARIGPTMPGQADDIRDILALEVVAMPYFGTTVSVERLDRHVREHWHGQAGSDRLQITACGPGDGRVIGAACLSGHMLSYFVAPKHWGQGIATQMIRHLRDHPHVTQAGHTLTAMIYRENRASIALVEKLGFRFAGLKPPANATFAGRAMLKYVLLQRR